MKHTTFRSGLIAMIVVLAMGMMTTVFATESEQEVTATPEQFEEENVIINNVPDSDVLFEEFMMKTAQEELGEGQEVKKSKRGDRLDGNCAIAYNFLFGEIETIARGEESSTVIEIPITEFLGEDAYKQYTAKDLGVDCIVKDDKLSDEAVEAMYEKLGFNRDDAFKTVKPLLYDAPYEMYWYDKSEGFIFNLPDLEGAIKQEPDDDVIYFDDPSDVTFKFTVSKDYMHENLEYTVDQDLAKTAVESAENAARIVEECDVDSDYGYLDAYKDQICDLVSYNDEAAEEGMSYGDPWQLVWVFDDDPKTTVVCEGYSKAFKYLCDLTKFNSEDLNCNTVTGVMGYWGKGGEKPAYVSGRHMWNIVSMEDDNNYLVDLTNCDEDEGWTSEYFLKGSDSVQEDEYTVNDIDYSYDGITEEMFDDEELAISTADYTSDGVHVHSFGEWDLVKPATCSEYGKKIRKCTVCNKVETASIGKGNHQFGDWIITVEPTINKEGVAVRECSACHLQQDGTVERLKNITKATVTGIANKTYSGKALTQAPVVKLSGKTLKNGKDYKLIYKNNKSVGKATVTVTGINAYGGTLSKTFKINPKGTTVKKLTAAKKGFTVKWAKQATQTSGYQIRCCLKSNFKSGVKTVTVNGSKNVNRKVTKLKAKNNYYVQIRTFKTVGKTKYYSGWSKAKKIKTK